MISRSTIDEIFNALRVEEVIGDFITLKRAGSNLKGLSPFSDEKSPSFMVSPAKQIWKDFSSGKGGTAVSFLMESEQFTYPEALRYLAKKYNIEIQEDREQTDEQKQKAKTKENLFTLTDFARKYFSQQLLETDEGKQIGLSYFKERGFTQEIITQFELGYSPKSRTAFYDYAIKKGYTKELISQSGICVIKEDFIVDRFRERVLFPIHGFSGRTIAFGGRILKSNAKAAKYLNSPESDIYHKSDVLYGLFQSKQHISKVDNCILVEGYTDVLSMHQNGIKNVVASSGTALTKNQIRLIKRLTNNITMLFDSDAAGIKAAFRGIDLILEQELNVKVLALPNGEDPDSFAQKHSEEEFKKYLNEHSTDFIQFKTNLLLADAQGDTVKKTALIRDIVRSISLVANNIQRELYIQECAALMEVSEKVLFSELQQVLQQKNKQDKRASPPRMELVETTEKEKEEALPYLQLIEQELLNLLLSHGQRPMELSDLDTQEEYITTVAEEIMNQLAVDQLTFSVETHQEIYQQIIDGFEQKKEIRTADFFIHSEQKKEIIELVSHLQFEKYELSERNQYKDEKHKYLKKYLMDVIYRFKFKLVEDMIKTTQLEIAQKETDNTKEASNALQIEKIMRLTSLKNSLNQLLNRIV